MSCSRFFDYERRPLLRAMIKKWEVGTNNKGMPTLTLLDTVDVPDSPAQLGRFPRLADGVSDLGFGRTVGTNSGFMHYRIKETGTTVCLSRR